MLRQSDNPDSDESISDEEIDELYGVRPNNVVSLDASTSATNKEELPLPVRLDFLKGICNQNLAGRGSGSSFEKPTGTPLEVEDEVEMPDFKGGDFSDISGEVVANSSDDEIISEKEGNTVLSTRQLHKCGPQFIRNEQVRDTNGNSEALLRPKGSASCSASHATCSKANRSGIWSKPKPRFSLSSLSHKYGNYLEDDGRMEINLDTEPAETEVLAHGFNVPSMADLFDSLQDKTNLYFPHDSQRRGKTVQLFHKSSRSHLQDTVVDSEDSPEPVDSGSSSGNEVSDPHMKITFSRKKMQTMADQFQEALGTSSVINEGTHVATLNPLRPGIFGKLQQVMQKEKERDTDFWKKLQTGARPDSKTFAFTLSALSILV